VSFALALCMMIALMVASIAIVVIIKRDLDRRCK